MGQKYDLETRKHIEHNIISFISSFNFRVMDQTFTGAAAAVETPISDELSPLVGALKASANRNSVPFHFPGHKRGQAAPPELAGLIGNEVFRHDATELPDLDTFFAPKGPLLKARKLAAELFGAKETWFLVGGTSCGVQAAIMATCSPGDTIVLPRNAHVSATTGIIFSGALPAYIVPEHNCEWDVAAGVTPLQVNSAIEESMVKGRKVAAVFMTSPTYHGVCSNVADIARVCHSHGIILIVDEAHGAHFKFHPDMPMTALDQGADISIQSTHKVLGSFSQSSMLHIAGNIVDRERLHKCIHILQSTSPNWLLLASLDASRHQLSANRDTLFSEPLFLANTTKSSLAKIPGITILDLSAFPGNFPAIDPLRITVGVWQLGLSGFQANKILDNELGIIPELVGTKSVTLAFSQGTVRHHVDKLVKGIKYLSIRFSGLARPARVLANPMAAAFGNTVMVLSPREAFFAMKTKMKFENCPGKICGEFVCPHPPGIPVLVPGELITKKALEYLREIIDNGGYVMGTADPMLSSIVVCIINNKI
ncbi:uncharacterized protein LOC127239580 [Andrographis paniculata]|uniref:uncharacterized protein LOC127239580 n=1 Tax=Andrographis paniculata TaxID=175694 RepID=UPI0021E6FC19|nr:uncharacterized protein LOC127239580 [Andrographis paniculata]